MRRTHTSAGSTMVTVPSPNLLPSLAATPRPPAPAPHTTNWLDCSDVGNWSAQELCMPLDRTSGDELRISPALRSGAWHAAPLPAWCSVEVHRVGVGRNRGRTRRNFFMDWMPLHFAPCLTCARACLRRRESKGQIEPHPSNCTARQDAGC